MRKVSIFTTGPLRRSGPVLVYFVGLLLLTAFAVGCHTPEVALRRYEFTAPAMGTEFRIALYAPTRTDARAAVEAAFQRVADLEGIMSDYQADSELMQLCDGVYGRPVRVSADLFAALEISEKVSQESDGAYDVTVGPYVRLWRFARKRKVLPTEQELAEARASVGWKNLRLDTKNRTVTLLEPNMRLDLGGIGKGYAADAALKVLRSKGFNRALVAASGDIALGDPPPGQPGWKVAIGGLAGGTNGLTFLLHNAGVSTSGDTEQFVDIGGVRYSHIIDPATGLGLTNRIQVTIVAPNATTTDSLDTTVSIMGVKRGLALVDSLSGTGALIFVVENGHTREFPSSRWKQLTQGR